MECNCHRHLCVKSLCHQTLELISNSKEPRAHSLVSAQPPQQGLQATPEGTKRLPSPALETRIWPNSRGPRAVASVVFAAVKTTKESKSSLATLSSKRTHNSSNKTTTRCTTRRSSLGTSVVETPFSLRIIISSPSNSRWLRLRARRRTQHKCLSLSICEEATMDNTQQAVVACTAKHLKLARIRVRQAR